MTARRVLPFYRATLVAACVLAVVLLSGMSGDSSILLPLGLVLTLVAGGIGYGITKQKADSAHARLDKLEESVGDRLDKQDKKLDRLIDSLTDLRVILAARARVIPQETET